jgi:hypothetical protein
MVLVPRMDEKSMYLGTNGSFGGMADGNSMYRDAFRDGAASYAGHPVPPF